MTGFALDQISISYRN